MAFSPDGRRIVSVSTDMTVKVWDATTGQETLTLKGHTDGFYRVAFSPDGRRIVSVSVDGTGKVWDATTGQETLTLKGVQIGLIAWPSARTGGGSSLAVRTERLWFGTQRRARKRSRSWATRQ